MNMWNVHIHPGMQNIHNVHNAHIDNIGILKHKKTRLLSSGTKFFITFWVKRLFDIRKKEAQSFYDDFSICPPPHHHVWHPLSSESQPSSLDARTQLTDFFQIPKILRVRFRCMTSFTSPGHIFYLGFLL